jgi:hypothetical protein
MLGRTLTVANAMNRMHRGAMSAVNGGAISFYHSKKTFPKPEPPLISKARAKRQPMTTKRANKNFYKGNGCRKEGFISSKGRFIPEVWRRTELVVPDLANFPLKAYIAVGVKKNIREVNPEFEKEFIA